MHRSNNLVHSRLNFDAISISHALALTIGWNPKHIGIGIHYKDECVGIQEQVAMRVGCSESRTFHAGSLGWCVVFDHTDWAVAGPIAAYYQAWTKVNDKGTWWVAGCKRHGRNIGQGAATPQDAIALAVIKGAYRKERK